MVELDELTVSQPSPNSRVVYWAFKPTNDSLVGLKVSIARSYSPLEAPAKIGEVVYPQTYFVDQAGNFRDFWRDANYQITFEHAGRVTISDIKGLRATVSVPAREMIRLHDLDLRFSGMPVLVYMKRKGERCPVCWDSALQKVTRGHCEQCYATGYRDGYYPPILTLANIMPEDKTNQPDVTQRELTRTSLKMSCFPALRPRDVIREVGSLALWRIDNVRPSELERVLIIQEIGLLRIETAEVEHKLTIPEGLDFLIKPHWAKIIRNSQSDVTRDKTTNPIERLNIWR